MRNNNNKKEMHYQNVFRVKYLNTPLSLLFQIYTTNYFDTSLAYA